MKTAARAKGAVYELLCFGPHNVELLSTAVRKLEPLGLRLLHAAHSHEDGSTKVEKGQSVSRFFVEKMRLGDLDDVTDEKLTEMVLKVLMTTYKMDDETKFSVRPGTHRHATPSHGYPPPRHPIPRVPTATPTHPTGTHRHADPSHGYPPPCRPIPRARTATSTYPTSPVGGR